MSSLALLFLTVPAVTALIGWVTNWAAVKMIFHPQRFIGVGPIGWQGVLPRRATGFALDVATTLTEKLISPRDLAERLDPVEMEKLLEDSLESESDEIVRDAAERLQPGAWDALPEPTRAMIIAQVRTETKQVAREIFDKLQGISTDLLDLRALIVSELSGRNTSKLVRLFQEIGARELKFIEYYGGIFGFFIGLGQVLAWNWLQVWWLMPIAGVIVGLVTNYLAIQMIFRPLERRRYLGIPYQGMFPKRQADIAKDYARITSDEVLSARNLIRLVTEGEAGERIAEIVVTTISARLVEISAKAQALVPVQITPAMIDEVKVVVVDRLQQAIPDIQPQLEEYLDRTLDVGNTIESKLAALSKPEFERILRGLFEKDEVILIVIGGVLGGAVGCLQALLVLAL